MPASQYVSGFDMRLRAAVKAAIGRKLPVSASSLGRHAVDVARPRSRRTAGRHRFGMATGRTGDPAAVDDEIGLRRVRLGLVLRVASEPSGRSDTCEKRTGG